MPLSKSFEAFVLRRFLDLRYERSVSLSVLIDTVYGPSLSVRPLAGVWILPDPVSCSVAFGFLTMGVGASQGNETVEPQGTRISTVIASRPAILGVLLNLADGQTSW